MAATYSAIAGNTELQVTGSVGTVSGLYAWAAANVPALVGGMLENYYVFTCKVNIGDGSTATTFTDTDVTVYFKGANGGFEVENNGTLNLDGFRGEADSAHWVILVLAGGFATINNYQLIDVGGGVSYGHAAVPTVDTTVFSRGLLKGFVFGASLGGASASNSRITIEDCSNYGAQMNGSASVSDLLLDGNGGAGASVPSLRINNDGAEASNITIANSADVDVATGGAVISGTLINSDFSESDVDNLLAGSDITRQFTYNMKVVDTAGTAINAATVKFTDNQANVTSVSTNASGVIAEQTLPSKMWTGTTPTVTNYNPYTIEVSKSGYVTRTFEQDLDTVAGENQVVELTEIGDQANPTFNDATLSAADAGDSARLELTIPSGTSNCGVSGVRYAVYMKAGSAPTVGTEGAIENVDFKEITDNTTLYIAEDSAGAVLVGGTTYYFKVLCIDQVGNVTGGTTTASATFVAAALPTTVQGWIDYFTTAVPTWDGLVSLTDNNDGGVSLSWNGATANVSTYPSSSVHFDVYCRENLAPTVSGEYLLCRTPSEEITTYGYADGTKFSDGDIIHFLVRCVDDLQTANTTDIGTASLTIVINDATTLENINNSLTAIRNDLLITKKDANLAAKRFIPNNAPDLRSIKTDIRRISTRSDPKIQ